MHAVAVRQQAETTRQQRFSERLVGLRTLRGSTEIRWNTLERGLRRSYQIRSSGTWNCL